MTIFFDDLEPITGGKILQNHHREEIVRALTDSRKAIAGRGSVFFAIAGVRHDGHQYIPALYHLGIRQFVVEKGVDLSILPEANVIQVRSSVAALQAIAIKHRSAFSIPVVGITGSNGKTIIKEWLYQLLSVDRTVLKTPGSYNSQIGVPLSILQLRPYHQIAVIEAGISTTGEMARLEPIIRPSIGLFTNIGTAHDKGFESIEQKIREKLRLFERADFVVYRKDHDSIDREVTQQGFRTFTWGTHPEADLRITGKGNRYTLRVHEDTFEVDLPFGDVASVENCFHCFAVMLTLRYEGDRICERLKTLQSVRMRLELKEGVNHSQLIDDTYNNDLAGLQISLDFLDHQPYRDKKTVILSDILQSGMEDRALVKEIAGLVQDNHISSFVGIGPALKSHGDLFEIPATFFQTTEEFLELLDERKYSEEIILIKGARQFGFERIVRALQRKVHGTVMEVELGALVHNLNFFRSQLRPETKIMAMVKAFAYGSGSLEIASLLQYHQVDYLGVAYTDEGVELRQHNIRLPVMVMSPSPETFDKLLEYSLQPEVYSPGQLRQLLDFLGDRSLKVHLKLETGMHRLGFEREDIAGLIEELVRHRNLEVVSIFSHLAGSDDATHDAFSREQAAIFQEAATEISRALGYKPYWHLLNTMGTLRLPEFQFDMVRLGIGLYGIDEQGKTGRLLPVLTLKTYITQVKNLSKGETVGYGRRGIATSGMRIAVIAIGYADGYSRAFSEGNGLVLIRGKRAPVVGAVCMDMTMVDITGIDAREGDEVILFGSELPVEELAARIKTIPYELFTSTSDRVKRVFWAESI